MERMVDTGCILTLYFSQLEILFVMFWCRGGAADSIYASHYARVLLYTKM